MEGYLTSNHYCIRDSNKFNYLSGGDSTYYKLIWLYCNYGAFNLNYCSSYIAKSYCSDKSPLIYFMSLFKSSPSSIFFNKFNFL